MLSATSKEAGKTKGLGKGKKRWTDCVKAKDQGGSGGSVRAYQNKM